MLLAEAGSFRQKVVKCMLDLGAGYLTQLEEAGSAETFLDSLFGTDCYSSALGKVGNECKGLEQGSKSRLAFMLTGCHLKQLGQKHTACQERMSLKQCADALDDRGYSTYLKFLAEIDRQIPYFTSFLCCLASHHAPI